MAITEQDIRQLNERGITLAEIEKQLTHFREGFPFVKLVKPATINDGIIALNITEASGLAAEYADHAARFRISKFVPASGAASRMFKDLFTFIEKSQAGDPGIITPAIQEVIDKLHLFAFYPDLIEVMERDGLSLHDCQKKGEYATILEYITGNKGLNYGNLPKGLLKFHRYKEYSRTSVEEHLAEGAVYAKDPDGIVRMHFTLSPEHIGAFLSLLKEVQPNYERYFQVTYDISYSIQKPSTDTIAVDLENEPFREADNRLVFRPGGHGALLENLNAIDADIVFIKNIDNVVPDHFKGSTILYKKVIGGMLINIQYRTHSYLKILENQVSGELLDEIRQFVKEELCINLSPDFEQLAASEQQEYLIHKLNRPIRICGMVQNQGEPGGGPFWLQNQSGEISLQIVESSQVDLNDPAQKLIFSGSTHFNPVDLVCAIRDYKGNAFNLSDFIDHATGFISIKSKDGRNLKAQELPGLWNGAMADWITIFVEVPLATFNPVKTINDLLRKEHQ